MDNHKNLLIIYPHFYPAWKDGGIVQSLNNTVRLLSADINVRVVTSSHDRQETQILDNIKLHQWNNVFGAEVYYLERAEENYGNLKKVIADKEYNVIYLNGLFSFHYVLLPLILWNRKFSKNIKLILAPRGMLQKGALNVKPLKKKLYLNLLRVSGLCKKVYWHATDEQEAIDIKENFGSNAIVNVTKDLPKESSYVYEKISKAEKELRLVYLSLIAEKKNLHIALEILANIKKPLIFDIYGPVKDKEYWEKCTAIIQKMPANIKVEYKGGVPPSETAKIFAQYHALFLPTNGENFGHVIYECLSAGRPVLISDKTPWNGLKEHLAGYNIPVDNRAAYEEAILELFNMNSEQYNKMCENANKMAVAYWQENNFKEMYLHLLSN